MAFVVPLVAMGLTFLGHQLNQMNQDRNDRNRAEENAERNRREAEAEAERRAARAREEAAEAVRRAQIEIDRQKARLLYKKRFLDACENGEMNFLNNEGAKWLNSLTKEEFIDVEQKAPNLAKTEEVLEKITALLSAESWRRDPDYVRNSLRAKLMREFDAV